MAKIERKMETYSQNYLRDYLLNEMSCFDRSLIAVRFNYFPDFFGFNSMASGYFALTSLNLRSASNLVLNRPRRTR